ncbi:MAG: hypothetical protein KatS3mg131_0889 [Candidatus Tectimicrobiota bacterium]|nr:MAG: hypothetical protein KatS3mg131_0889 [Candidatus Tectomicrobia bacterium]
MKYRVLVEHRETFIIEASCAAEAQAVAADFATHRGDSAYAGQVLEHADEMLSYVCTQLEACQHTEVNGDTYPSSRLDEDHIDA